MEKTKRLILFLFFPYPSVWGRLMALPNIFLKPRTSVGRSMDVRTDVRGTSVWKSVGRPTDVHTDVRRFRKVFV